MGVDIKELMVRKPVSFEELNGKVLAVDAFNFLYQFISTIRLPDGSPLRDSQGNVTSHISGLFSRGSFLMKRGIKLVFVFDGIPPELKREEIIRRTEMKKQAQASYEKAAAEENIEEMKKYAGRTSRLTAEMVSEAKQLINALGLPYIEAPSEGEAQATHLVRKNEAYAVVSEDYDCLLFGAPRWVHNLSVTGRRKVANKLSYKPAEPEIIVLEESLKALGLSQEQLILLGMLVGTDYNKGGIKGIGPKKALQLVKSTALEKLFEELHWSSFFDYPWQQVYELFAKMPVNDDYSLSWKAPNKDKIIDIMCAKHDFSEERISAGADELVKCCTPSQKSLGVWFK